MKFLTFALAALVSVAAVHANPTAELDYGEMAERAINDLVCTSNTKYIKL